MMFEPSRRTRAFLCWCVIGWGCAAQLARAEQAEQAPRELTLKDALDIAAAHSPSLQQARAQSDAAEGRTVQSRSVLLPQLTGTASYARVHGAGTGQLGAGAGTSTAGLMGGPQGTYNRFSIGAAVTQVLWDYRAIENLRASGLNFDAQRATERATFLQTQLDVRTRFFEAVAARALIHVQEELVENQRLNSEEVAQFVKVGVRPEIDLLQAQTDFANARVQLLSAQNTYAVAKAGLRQSIGMQDASSFEVADDELGEMQQEGRALTILVDDALAHRPEIESLERSRAAAEASLAAARGGYLPTVAANAGIAEVGRQFDGLSTNWNLGVSLTWQAFQGGLTTGQVEEARALSIVQVSQLSAIRLQVQYDVEQAKSTIENTRASLSAAEEALRLARSQLEQAQGRYREGISTIIELREAQFAVTSASSQLVQAQLNLYRARAQLMAALGQDT
jgi:outer membrane protein